MKRRPAVNLALLALIVLLAGLLLLPAPSPEEATPPLTRIDPATVESIRIQRPGHADIRMERGGDHWMLSAPLQMRAHPARVNGLLGLLAEPSLGQVPAPDAPARLGLDPPAATLWLGEHAFRFGGVNPLGRRRYLDHDGTVHLVADTLFFQFTQGAGYFADNRLLPDGARVARITYPRFVLAAEQGSWTSRPDAGLTPEQIRETALHWQSARAVSVRHRDPGEPPYTVEVQTRDGRTFAFGVLSTAAAPVLARADLGVHYHLDALTGRRLLISTGDESQVTGNK